MSTAQTEALARVVIVDSAAIAARGEILFPGARVIVANGHLPPEAIGFPIAFVITPDSQRIETLCSALVAADCPQVHAWQRDISDFTTRQQVLDARDGVKEYKPTIQPSAIVCTRLSDIESKPIRWLWPGRIARGKVSMIAGHPGLGKSQVTNSLASIVTQGGQWPVDRTRCERGNVLCLSAEDDPADTIRPRLEAAGADIGRVYILQAIRNGFNADGDELRRPFNLREDIRRLETLVVEIDNVALIVIDPVSAYLGGTDSHNNADVRTLLAPLGDMASRTGAAVVAVSHLNKGSATGGSDALLRVTGSLAFVAASRAAYIVAKDPADEKRRLFLPAKNNIGPDIGGLAFGIEAATVGPGIDTSRVVWEAQAVQGMSADEVLRAPADGEGRSELDESCDWLKDALSQGPVDARELFSFGDKQGFHKRALQRARQRVGAQTRREGFGKGSKVVWFLPIDDRNTIDDCPNTQSPMGKGVTYGGDEEPVA